MYKFGYIKFADFFGMIGRHLTNFRSTFGNLKIGRIGLFRLVLEQRALKYLLSPLLQKEGIYLAVNGKVEHFIPHISTILADMSEAQSICCTYKSYCTTCPCYKCLTPEDQLNNMHIDENSIILRTHENMSTAVFSHDAAKYSIHEHKNFFWNFR